MEKGELCVAMCVGVKHWSQGVRWGGLCASFISAFRGQGAEWWNGGQTRDWILQGVMMRGAEWLTL